MVIPRTAAEETQRDGLGSGAGSIPLVSATGPPRLGERRRDAPPPFILAPHPRTRRTSAAVVEVMRKGCLQVDAPADLIQVIESPPIAKTEVLMRICDLVVATGCAGMVKAAYSSGAPAYGVGVGNAAHIVDETADLDDAAVMGQRASAFRRSRWSPRPPRASPNLPESSLLLIVPFS
jgi:hypothetical protein